MESQNQQNQSPQFPSQMPSVGNNLNKSKMVPIFLGIAAVIIIAIGAYVLGTKQSQQVIQNSVQPTPIPSPIPIPTPIVLPTIIPSTIANWKLTKNDKYGFELKLPPEYELEGPMSDASSEYFYIRMLSNVPDAYLTIYKVGSSRTGYGPDALEKNILINGISGKEIAFMYTDPVYGKESPCSVYEFATSSYIYEFSGYEGCFNMFPTTMKILNTFTINNKK